MAMSAKISSETDISEKLLDSKRENEKFLVYNHHKYDHIHRYAVLENITPVSGTWATSKDDRYIPLVIDGASGTGKTQQAFALARQENARVVYTFMGDASLESQPIYQEVDEAFGLTAQRDLIEQACRYSLDTGDPLNVESFRYMKSRLSGHNDLPFGKLIANLLDSVFHIRVINMAESVDPAAPADNATTKKIKKMKESNSLTIKPSNALAAVVTNEPIGKSSSASPQANLEQPGTAAKQSKVVEIWRPASVEEFDAALAEDRRRLPGYSDYKLLSGITWFIEFPSDQYDQATGQWRDADGNTLPNKMNCYSMLRFVCNLGSAQGAQVIVAGSGSMCATMIALRPPVLLPPVLRPPVYHSRMAPEYEGLWMVIELLWKPPSEDFVRERLPDLGSAVQAQLCRERPLLANLLAELGSFMNVGDRLQETKKFPLANILRWMCGVYLDGDRHTYSALGIKGTKPSEMVKRHFFEPAVPLCNGVPYFGKGLGCVVTRKAGPLRLTLSRWGASRVDGRAWILELVSSNGVNQGKIDLSQASATLKSIDVEWAMSHCVQQCLVREPLMAFTLSLCNRFADPAEFRRTVIEAMRDGNYPLSAVSKAIWELVGFAALQQANGRSHDIGSRDAANLHNFIVRLCEVLCSFRERQRLQLVDQGIFKNLAAGTSEAKTKTVQWDDIVTKAFESPDDKDDFTTTLMPWLVPACSEAELREKIAACPNLFESSNLSGGPFKLELSNSGGGSGSTSELRVVAGLVPGPVDNRMEALAIPWCTAAADQIKPSAKSEWQFEFRDLTHSFTGAGALADLGETMKDRNPLRHGMIICLSESGDEVLVTRFEKYWRIAIVISTSA